MKKVLIIVLVIFLILILIAVGAFLGFKSWYDSNLEAVNSGKKGEEVVVEITSGMKTIDIAKTLEKNKVIKNADVFKLYLKLNKINDLKAGKYVFDNSKDDVKAVVKKISNYDIQDNSIKVTFIEGKTFSDYENVIAEKTNNTVEDVENLVNNEEYIDSLIENYWFITEDIKNQDIRDCLEGYLKPDTYTFDDEDVTVEEIFKIILDVTNKFLSKYRSQIEDSGYSVHEILTLASVIEKEAVNSSDMPEISGVFYNRLNSNMPLGSDVTTYYAFNIDMSSRDLSNKEINTYNPYNTRGPNMEGKLPVGPICNPSESAIEAAIEPMETENYYFVSDKNGKTYFTKTYSEHTKKVQELKKSGLWFTYN